jgi:hypothetical protein
VTAGSAAQFMTQLQLSTLLVVLGLCIVDTATTLLVVLHGTTMAMPHPLCAASDVFIHLAHQQLQATYVLSNSRCVSLY